MAERNNIFRALILLTVVAVLFGARQWWVAANDDVLQIARQQAGSYRFRLDFEDRIVGSYASGTSFTQDTLVIESALHAEIPDAGVLNVAERLVFATSAPYRLLSAQHEVRSGAGTRHIVVTPRDRAYTVEISHNARHTQRDVDWQYTLADHLEAELWLRTEQPKIGATLDARQLDFSRVEPIAVRWKLLDLDADGGRWLGLDAAGEDKVFNLDANLVPRAASSGGVLTLTRLVDDAAEIIPGPITHSGVAKVTLTDAIAEPARLRATRLGINEETARVLSDHLSVSGPPGARQLRLARRQTLVSDEALAAADMEPQLPGGDPLIRRLVARALGGADSSSQKIANLTRFVNTYIDYQPDVQVLSILDTLEQRVGDCTEFANLLTSLARASGFSARTVTGLAYAEAEGPGFYLHAWTEIADDGIWHAVDPTFGQTDLGPTHIPFPESDTGYLRAYAAIPTMRFEVLALDYEDPAAEG